MTEPPSIDPAGADTEIGAGALLLDVRGNDEWAAGHAPAARHVPLDELAARVGELPTDRRIVVVCRSGGRSARATSALTGAGFDAVNLAGGMRAWAEVGLPCVDETGAPGTVA